MALEELELDDIDPTDASQLLRDEILTVVRTELDKPWQQMTQFQQERVVQRVEGIATRGVRKITDAIGGMGRDVVLGTLGPLGVDKKGKFKVAISFEVLDDTEKLAIINHISRGIHLVCMDASEYTNFRDKAETLPDQHRLPEPGAAKQPNWPEVAAKLAADADNAREPEVMTLGEPEVSAQPVKNIVKTGDNPTPGDAPDAGEALEDETAAKRVPGGDLLDDEDMDDSEIPPMPDLDRQQRERELRIHRGEE